VFLSILKQWVDPNLTWKPSDYSGIKFITLPAVLVWVPDIHLFNSATEDDLIYPENVQILSDGKVISSPIRQLYAHCDFDFSRFPYDSQTCAFKLGTMIDTVKLELKSSADEKLQPNPEWHVTGVNSGSTYGFVMPGTSHNQQEAFSYDWSVSSFTVKAFI